MAKGNKKSDCGILGSLLIPALFGFCLYLIFTSINQSKLYEGATDVPESGAPVQACKWPKVPIVKTDKSGITFKEGNIHFDEPRRAHCGAIGSARQIRITDEGRLLELGKKIECAHGQGIKEGECVDCPRETKPNPKMMINFPDELHAYTGLVEGDYHLEMSDDGEPMVVNGGVECIAEN